METEQFTKIGKEAIKRTEFLTRWIILSSLLGMVLGVVAGLFGRGIGIVTDFRNTHPWMLYLLPLGGLLIVFLYRFDNAKTSTNLVLEGVSKGKREPFRMAPLIIASTIITHAFGGSAGREGAALQLGGSIGATIGRGLKRNAQDQKILIMAGMSGAFSALFGTPLTAAIFAMEVVCVGNFEMEALIPCTFSALVGKYFAKLVGASGEAFHIEVLPRMTIRNDLLIILLGVCCSLICLIFINLMHGTEHLAKKIENRYIRIVVGALAVILLTTCLGTRDYLGAGMQVIERAIEGEAVWSAFLLKMIFTALTLGFGFKGGEIVPTLFIGATFGCLFGNVVGLSPGFCAACAMVAMFAGVTNCPLSALLLSAELFGFEDMAFYLLAISVCFMLSGHNGLYHSQKYVFHYTPYYANFSKYKRKKKRSKE